MYFFTCGQPRKKTDRHVTGEKEKSGKKERVRRKYGLVGSEMCIRDRGTT